MLVELRSSLAPARRRGSPSWLALCILIVGVLAQPFASHAAAPRPAASACSESCDKKAAECVDACEEKLKDDAPRIKCKLACIADREKCEKDCQ
jgi:hypothetical protein